MVDSAEELCSARITLQTYRRLKKVVFWVSAQYGD